MRQTAFVCLARLVLGLALGAPGAQSSGHRHIEGKRREATTPGPVPEGRKTFKSHCAACHGLDGRGGEHAPDIFSSPRIKTFSDRRIAEIIHDGIPRRGMPAFNLSLTQAQTQGVVAFIRSAGGKPGYSQVNGDPVRGQALFFGKARCSDCHMIRGKGGFLGPDLSRYGRDHSPIAIRDAIVKPNAVLSPGSEVVTVMTQDGRRLSGIARNEDNFSLQLLDSDGKFHLLMKSDLAEVKHESGSLMPGDYGSRLSKAEIDDLIGYLVGG